MKQAKVEGTITRAFEQDLATPVPYSGTCDEYETYAEVEAANKVPSHDDIVSFVNQRIKANARQALMATALEMAGIKKPTLEDPRVQFNQIVKSLVAAKKSREEAVAAANGLLGTSFTD